MFEIYTKKLSKHDEITVPKYYPAKDEYNINADHLDKDKNRNTFIYIKLFMNTNFFFFL